MTVIRGDGFSCIGYFLYLPSWHGGKLSVRRLQVEQTSLRSDMFPLCSEERNKHVPNSCEARSLPGIYSRYLIGRFFRLEMTRRPPLAHFLKTSSAFSALFYVNKRKRICENVMSFVASCGMDEIGLGFSCHTKES